MEEKNHIPTLADEALMSSMLATQTVGAIQQAHVDGKMDRETYTTLFAAAQKAAHSIRALAERLEKPTPWGSDVYTGEPKQADHADSSEAAWWNPSGE